MCFPGRETAAISFQDDLFTTGDNERVERVLLRISGGSIETRCDIRHDIENVRNLRTSFPFSVAPCSRLRVQHLKEKETMPLPTLRSSVTGDIDSVFDRFLSDWSLPMSLDVPAAPSLDVYEKGGTYYAELAIPGYKPEDVNVDVSGNILTVNGKFDTTTKAEDAKYHRREIRRGAFERSIALPQELDPATITAKVERGILNITAKPMKATTSTKVKVTGT
jgi:HSP20 family protein